MLYIYNNWHFSKIWSQLSADFILDIFDKTITVLIVVGLLKFLPNKVLNYLPLGKNYFKDENHHYIKKTVDYHIINKNQSISYKIAYVTIITSLVLGIFATTISSVLYRDEMNENNIKQSASIISICKEVINEDEIMYFLETKDATNEDYQKTYQNLKLISDSFKGDLKYIYVYYIKDEVCHVVFDIDPEGDTLGTEFPSEASYDKYTDILNVGGPIDPVVTNDRYGWLYTTYEPLFDSNNKYVGYIGVDLDMREVMGNRYAYIIQLVALLFGASILIVSLSLLYSRKRMVEPLNLLTSATQDYAFGIEEKENFQKLKELKLTSNDEIEKLYKAILKTTTDMDKYIEEIHDKNIYISSLQDNIIMSFAEMVESRDENTGEHIHRTSNYVKIICKELLRYHVYEDELSQEKVSNIIKSAPLHDIGKVKIPDAILNKPGRLTKEEFEIIKTHTTEGRKILERALKGIEGENYLRVAVNMANSHHERYDGTGYPNGLAGNNIPICARIMAVADVFDALTSKRSYKDPFSFEESVKIIKECSGTQFDPIIVDVFMKSLDKIKEELECE